MGSMEVAEFLRVTRQRVVQLRETALWRKHVPSVCHLRAGPIFLAEEVRNFEAVWPRTPGRPRKEAGAASPE